MAKIVLASASPRRQELLRRIGIEDFDIRVPEVEEAFPQGLTPPEVVAHISREKADAAAALCAGGDRHHRGHHGLSGRPAPGKARG